MSQRKVIIVGAGPAGMACAIQLKHCGIEPLVIEKNGIGGLLKNANLVENFPGFPGGIPGIQLARLFEKQFIRAGIELVKNEVTKAEYTKGKFCVNTRTREYRSDFLVIASGTKPRIFNDCAIPEDAKNRVFYEVYPLLNTEDKKIVIIGSGDAAFDYSLNLAQKNEVNIFNRSNTAKCLEILYDRAMKVKNISYNTQTTLTSIGYQKDRLVLGAICKTGEVQMETDYLLIAIGREPALDFFSEEIRNKIINLDIEDKLYMIGDVRNGSYRQTAIAVGDGVRAALEIYYKENKN
ncbi:NAD(P)/FAD-dependent oxidoreductase [bacterium]|nr:NAD(P)/FAD-dependent oxidoreductase [bacterium]